VYRAGSSRVTHPFAGFHEVQAPRFVPRLACVKPAASVRPEPGSNSPIREQDPHATQPPTGSHTAQGLHKLEPNSQHQQATRSTQAPPQQGSTHWLITNPVQFSKTNQNGTVPEPGRRLSLAVLTGRPNSTGFRRSGRFVSVPQTLAVRSVPLRLVIKAAQQVTGTDRIVRRRTCPGRSLGTGRMRISSATAQDTPAGE
jgi:hypothetical protein